MTAYSMLVSIYTVRMGWISDCNSGSEPIEARVYRTFTYKVSYPTNFDLLGGGSKNGHATNNGTTLSDEALPRLLQRLLAFRQNLLVFIDIRLHAGVKCQLRAGRTACVMSAIATRSGTHVIWPLT